VHRSSGIADQDRFKMGGAKCEGDSPKHGSGIHDSMITHSLTLCHLSDTIHKTVNKERDMARIAVEANCSARTVRRFLDGRRVLPAIEAAIQTAAKALRIRLVKKRTLAISSR
jgi:hypothetical protein